MYNWLLLELADANGRVRDRAILGFAWLAGNNRAQVSHYKASETGGWLLRKSKTYNKDHALIFIEATYRELTGRGFISVGPMIMSDIRSSLQFGSVTTTPFNNPVLGNVYLGEPAVEEEEDPIGFDDLSDFIRANLAVEPPVTAPQPPPQTAAPAVPAILLLDKPVKRRIQRGE